MRVQEERISRKAEPKTKFWQKKLAKWTKTKEKKQRKNKFGRIGLFVLLAGVVSLFLFDPLFLLSLLIATIYGTIGLVKDERKTAAILSVAIPAGFILLVLILVGANWSE
jgi:UDP-N-acetylmuramyl pentapeptide phosphotransferase/UDP-N-acetylglucosamine-1-phosphate transferase